MRKYVSRNISFIHVHSNIIHYHSIFIYIHQSLSQNVTLPETNSSPLKIGHPKKETSIPTFQPSIVLRCENVSFREGSTIRLPKLASLFGSDSVTLIPMSRPQGNVRRNNAPKKCFKKKMNECNKIKEMNETKIKKLLWKSFKSNFEKLDISSTDTRQFAFERDFLGSLWPWQEGKSGAFYLYMAQRCALRHSKFAANSTHAFCAFFSGSSGSRHSLERNILMMMMMMMMMMCFLIRSFVEEENLLIWSQ